MTDQSTEQQTQTDQLSFEQAIEQLEQLIEKIESGEVGLEESLKHYEQGTELIKRCRSILDSAEQRISELTESESGQLQVEQTSDDTSSSNETAE